MHSLVICLEILQVAMAMYLYFLYISKMVHCLYMYMYMFKKTVSPVKKADFPRSRVKARVCLIHSYHFYCCRYMLLRIILRFMEETSFFFLLHLNPKTDWVCKVSFEVMSMRKKWWDVEEIFTLFRNCETVFKQIIIKYLWILFHEVYLS